jgi:uncharacterized protein
MIVYCDSAILIYYFEHTGPLQVQASSRLAALHTSGHELAVSDLVRLECRVKPIRLGNAAALAVFDQFFNGGVRIAPINRAVFDRATDIRAQFKYGMADSIHLAAAIEAGCGLFLTNDTRLASFPSLTIDVF